MTAAESVTHDESEVTGVPWGSTTLLAVLAATLMTPLDVPLVSPVLTEIQAVFGVSEAQAGLVITLYAAPGILLAPLIGMAADRIGRRYVLSGCLVVFGLAGSAVALAPGFEVVLALRLLQGCAAGSVLAALSMTVVGDRYGGRRHDAVMGVTAAVLSFATAVYPAVGGYLADAVGWHAPFALYALCLPVAGVVFLALDDRRPDGGTVEGGYLREAVRAVPTRRAVELYGVMFCAYVLLFGGLYTAVPFYLGGSFGFGPAQVGLVTSGVLLVTGVVSTQNGRLTRRTSQEHLVVLGFALLALAFLGVGVATTVPSLVTSLLVFGVGSGLVTPTLFAGLSRLAPDHVRGGVMSLQTTTIGASQTVGPALFTLLGAEFGYEPLILGVSVATAVATVAIAALWLRA